MDITIILSQVLGIMFTVLGLSMIFNKKWTAAAVADMDRNSGLLWLAGLVALMLGAAIVALNNYWTSGLPLFITILGWLTLFKGAFILICPDMAVHYYRKVNKGNVFVAGGVIVLVLGLILFLM